MLKSCTDCMNRAAPGILEAFLRKHPGSAGAVAPSSERGYGIHRGIRHDDLVESPQFVRHGREGDVLVSLNVAVDAPGILLGKEPFGHRYVEVAGEEDGDNGENKNAELMAKNDRQHAI